MKACAALLIFVSLFGVQPARADDSVHSAMLRDISTVAGVRDNSVFGYGLVVGLKGTGDRQQTVFTIQTLINVLSRMGVQLSSSSINVKNVAAVFVTANLPPFTSAGSKIDVTVSSAGDATSLEGGLLLLTPLYAADGQVYAAAQGWRLSRGDGREFEAVEPSHRRAGAGRRAGRARQLNRLERMPMLNILLSEPNFSTAEQVAGAINREIHGVSARVRDSRRIEVERGPDAGDVPGLLAHIENLSVEVHRRARVIINERTGTIVMGREVRLGAVSILHGSFSIQVTTKFAVSQPQPLASGETKVVPETNVQAEETESRRIELTEGASVELLVDGLQKIGATSRDVIAILQAIMAAGALDADLEVI